MCEKLVRFLMFSDRSYREESNEANLVTLWLQKLRETSKKPKIFRQFSLEIFYSLATFVNGKQ